MNRTFPSCLLLVTAFIGFCPSVEGGHNTIGSMPYNDAKNVAGPRVAQVEDICATGDPFENNCAVSVSGLVHDQRFDLSVFANLAGFVHTTVHVDLEGLFDITQPTVEVAVSLIGTTTVQLTCTGVCVLPRSKSSGVIVVPHFHRLLRDRTGRLLGRSMSQRMNSFLKLPWSASLSANSNMSLSYTQRHTVRSSVIEPGLWAVASLPIVEVAYVDDYNHKGRSDVRGFFRTSPVLNFKYQQGSSFIQNDVSFRAGFNIRSCSTETGFNRLRDGRPHVGICDKKHFWKGYIYPILKNGSAVYASSPYLGFSDRIEEFDADDLLKPFQICAVEQWWLISSVLRNEVIR